MIASRLITIASLFRIGLFMLLATFISVASAESKEASTMSYIKFNTQGELVRPIDYREWIFIGTPLTPNDMNKGKAAFPEFHNVYIDPLSWRYWKQNGLFPDETIIVKELVSVGTKRASSGNGYFQGEYIGLEASVKSKRQFPNAQGHWGFFRFTIEGENKLRKSSVVQPAENCLSCHQSNAATDQVFSQYYPVLRDVKSRQNNLIHETSAK